MKTSLTITVKQTGDRNSTRKLVLDEFLKEKPGTGKKDKASNYVYYVETLQNGRRIFLTRPAWNHVGFDFVIHVEGQVFANKKTNPAHKDVYGDLKKKAEENPKNFRKLYEAIIRVHQCEDPEDVLRECATVKFQSGLSCEEILKIIKWFFIEQDIRYWNYSGRDMFITRVNEIASEVKSK